MKKGIYFLLVLVTLCWYSCGTPSTETNEGETPTTTVQEENGTVDATTSTPTSDTNSGASKITDDIVAKVCACKKQATGEDGSMDIEAIRSCMGAPTLPDYVKQLLGSSASEKEISDAENELAARMKSC